MNNPELTAVMIIIICVIIFTAGISSVYFLMKEIKANPEDPKKPDGQNDQTTPEEKIGTVVTIYFFQAKYQREGETRSLSLRAYSETEEEAYSKAKKRAEELTQQGSIMQRWQFAGLSLKNAVKIPKQKP